MRNARCVLQMLWPWLRTEPRLQLLHHELRTGAAVALVILGTRKRFKCK